MEENKNRVKITNRVVRGRNKEGLVTINDYIMHQLLGKGSYGKVKLCSSSGMQYAIKIYSKSLLKRKKDYVKNAFGRLEASTALQAVVKELEIMKRLDHPNVIRVHEILEDESSEKLYMVIDYCEKGSIMEWDSESRRFWFPWTRSPLTSSDLRRIIIEIVTGLQYLHSINIVHRDIKPQNILLTSTGSIKIADLGQAQDISDSDMLSSTVGTYYFFAPECCNTNIRTFSGKAADIWALGITIYALVYQKLPFWADSLLGIFEVIHNSEILYERNDLVTEDFEDLLRKILEKDPNKRISLGQILMHRWIRV